jgi:hypothetical protein
MIGVVVIALIVVVALPLAFWALYALAAVVLGWLLTRHAEVAHAGSDLIETNY